MTPHPDTPPNVLANALVSTGVVVLGLFLLISPAGTGIGLLLMLAGSLAMLPRVWQTRPWREPFVQCGVLLLAFIAGHTLWQALAHGPSDVPPGRLIGRYQELWLAPLVLAAFMASRKQNLFFKALLLGGGAVAALHWLDHWGLHLVQPEYLAARRISAGFGLVVVAWLALDAAQKADSPWPLRIYSMALAVTVLFAMDGRTGHVLLILLGLLAGWLYGKGPWRWVLSLLLPGLIVLGALSSASVQSRMQDTLSGLKSQTSQTEISSAGIRRDLYTLGAELGLEHAWTGSGYARVPSNFHAMLQDRLAKDPSKTAIAQTTFARPNNLHNEYLMQWVGGGVAGLLLFGLWLVAPLASSPPQDPYRKARFGLVAAFAAGCLFNSWLMDFAEGHMYMVLLAWMISQSKSGERTDLSSARD